MVITDAADRMLIVKPNYQPHWSLPGGSVEDGEAPHQGAAREVAEEVGLDLAAGDLLVVDWVAAEGTRPRAVISYLFDGGTVDGSVRLPPGLPLVRSQAAARSRPRLDPGRG